MKNKSRSPLASSRGEEDRARGMMEAPMRAGSTAVSVSSRHNYTDPIYLSIDKKYKQSQNWPISRFRCVHTVRSVESMCYQNSTFSLSTKR